MSEPEFEEIGYTCPCGKFIRPDGYAVAHWRERLIHHCVCGRKNEVLAGDLLSSEKIGLQGNQVKKARGEK